jgi:hypothetical protein
VPLAGKNEPVGHYSRVMTTSGFFDEPSERTVILIESASGVPINRPKASSMSVFAR